MHPILVHLGPVTLYTYGLLVATGFLFGISWATRLARQEGVDADKVYDTSFWIIVGAIVGSRIVYVLVNLDHFIAAPADVFKLWQGGLVFYGGLIGAAIAVTVCVRRYGLDFWQFTDIAAPAAALGHSIGRLGCFFAGCCYGAHTDVPWAVTFHNVESIAPTGIPIHPTQLYSSALELSLFLLLALIRPHRKFKGQIFLTWLILYAIGRSIIESYRGDPRGVWFDGMITTSQLIAAAAITIAVTLYMRMRNRNDVPVVPEEKPPAAQPDV